MDPITIVLAVVGGAAVGFGGNAVVNKRKAGSQADQAAKELEKAKKEANKLVTEARNESLKLAEEARKDEQTRRKELKTLESRLVNREEALDRKLDELDKRTQRLRKGEDEVEALKDEIRDIRTKQQEKLEKVAKLSKEEAAEKLMQMTERDIKNDLTGLVNKLQNEARDEAEEAAGLIIVTAMERMASEVTAERTVTSVDIMVDDTPGYIVLSSFDPVRREVARQTLEMLMKDGRIHPGRIEEVVAKAQKNVEKEVVRAGEDAAREVGVIGIPKDIMHLLGELKFRTSYGQNVLKHSTEMAHIAGMIAEEVGANVKTAKYAALVHDLGKAMSHKIEGKHHHISGEMLRKYGAPEAVALAAEQHHDDVEATSVEALVIRVVDAISAARPGARNISAENFVERMKELENVANGFEGIEKSYAISAGREVRVFVKPQRVDDLTAIKLARDIATKIESTMQYPGTIKVNVIRETRAVEFAK
jgi:ribonuclease Y